MFLNSNSIIPEGNSVNHVDNLPVPFPILEPFIFLLKGKCGNKLNHTERQVKSNFLLDFFKNNLIRKMCLLFKRIGCKSFRPCIPTIKLQFFIFGRDRLLKIFLYINFLGRNNIYKCKLIK